MTVGQLDEIDLDVPFERLEMNEELFVALSLNSITSPEIDNENDIQPENIHYNSEISDFNETDTGTQSDISLFDNALLDRISDEANSPANQGRLLTQNICIKRSYCLFTP
eukprot:TRINITY_DN114_c0_g1_i1.p1 TRINITY_DN114_c0_g1~~TRINITY_DN114_c0_g1_i1.p1  ORF type:complete len:110 (+),score=31.59 TRINITY_DN114_c0_g1_i1:110-439(+)